MTTVFLDSAPLSLLSHPRPVETVVQWARALTGLSIRIAIAEIADYEVRRELLRAGRLDGLARLDAIQLTTRFVPISTDAMRLAARLWADASSVGRPTAPDAALDADVILAAQALSFAAEELDDVIVATTNVGHLGRYVPAAHWTEIRG